MFIGWDRASTTHDITVLDDRGMVVRSWALSNTEQALITALKRLGRHGDPAELPVIVERPDGLVVDRLLTAGHPLFPVHPTAFHAARPRWERPAPNPTPVTATNSPTIYASTATACDGCNLPTPASPSCREIDPLGEDHVRARTAATNQLAALLEAHWLGPRKLFQCLASPIALALLTDYPTPDAARRLGEDRMRGLLRRNSYRGGKTATELLRDAPLRPAHLPTTTLATMIHAQVQLLRAVQATISEVEKLIKELAAVHSRARLLAALPGRRQVNVAQLLAEVGPILMGVDTAEQAAAECGTAPVTKASGKVRGVYFRWAANTRARTAITAFAHNARLQSPWSAKLYANARARGKRNPHAIRIVAGAWLRVIWAC